MSVHRERNVERARSLRAWIALPVLALLATLVVVVTRRSVRESVPVSPAPGESDSTALGREGLAGPGRAPVSVDEVAPAPPLPAEPAPAPASGGSLPSGTRLSIRAVDQAGRAVGDRELLLTRRPVTLLEERAPCYLQFEDTDAAFARARTDSQGRAAFDGVPAGVYWLGPAKEEVAAEAQRDAVAAVAIPLEILEAEREREITLELDRGLVLVGRIVDAAGVPVARAFVGCEHERVRGFVTGDVAEDGSFALGPVAAGVSNVRAVPHGRYQAPEPERAEPDGTDIVITLRPGATLAGLVVDAGSGAPAAAEVVCSREDGAPAPHGSIGPEGAFRFSGLAAGRHGLAARTQDGRAGWLEGLELAEGATLSDVRLELHPGAGLELRFEVEGGGPDRAAYRIQAGTALVASGELARGVAERCTVPATRLVITVEPAGRAPVARQVDVLAGERPELVVELLP